MRKNRTLRLAAILLVVVLITTCAFTGTLAKYTVGGTLSTQQARVGAFRVDINGADVAAGESIDPTTVLLPLKEADSSVDEEDFYQLNGDVIIFPGSGNTLPLEVVNYSEVPVTADLEISSFTLPIYTGTNKAGDTVTATIPVEISFNGGASWVALSSIIAGYSFTQVELDAYDGTTADSVTFDIQWRWSFEADGSGDYDDGTANIAGQTDAKDTILGSAVAQELLDDDGVVVADKGDITTAGLYLPTISFTYTVTQVD
ncbi:MAG: hypothetical protein LBQ80_04405 [Clostridium sp.]|jgi:hypothetical protein|nr:hypothetical protein [Clostridium sp.]